ncbi:DMT family transporter [Tengunoibacter tsumagoiensis]|uniref:Membrane protein n=1 Tax=Tengunoibacter tsumagoiensis TaxID=2014871 RepID=A0A401ZXT3_9CHLR|nr:DMT family transporter [Tengunoibacter tsumagoiensis]GCE11643.1 membrane protein [Tengunoibacter tsumagoiensis]
MKPDLAGRSDQLSADDGASKGSSSRIGLLYVVVAVLFFSTSPIFVRWAQPFNPVEIAFWRLTIAALLVCCLGLLTHQRLLLRRQEFPRFLFYGLITALHFLFYIAALSYTTIAHALALTYTSPIFVTLFATFFLKEPLPLRKWLGIGVAVIGIAIMAGFEPHYNSCSLHGQCMVLGDGLGLLAGICYAIYSIAGRGERTRHPIFRYTTNVYGLAALWLLPLTLILAFTHTYPPTAIAALVALGIFPLGLGHTLYNASIRKIHATYANLIASQEVTFGILLGIFFVHDIPSTTTFIGVGITLVGIIGVLI